MTKLSRKTYYQQLKLVLNFSTKNTFRTPKRGKMSTPFTPRSARPPSKAGKPEVQFSFVDLTLSGSTPFPFASNSRLFVTPKLNLAEKSE